MSDRIKKIRVLRIVNRFNLGGPTYNAAYLSRYLGSEFETRLIGGLKDPSEASSEFIVESLGLKAKIIPDMQRSISPIQDFKAFRKILSLIREYQPHIVHTHASKAGLIGRLAAMVAGVPVVIHTFHGHVFHSYFGNLESMVFKQIERLLAWKTSRIIAISQEQKRELSTLHRIAPPDKFRVIPLGFDLWRFGEGQTEKRETFRNRYGLTSNDIAVGIIGRLVPIKNHSMFLRAAHLVMQHQKTQFRFFIIGDGESRNELERQCVELGLMFTRNTPPSAHEPICFTSWIKEIDVVCSGLDIVCLTSLNEGTPVSLIEAQSASRPVVSTRVGGITDIVVEGVSAKLCNANDHQAFADAIAELGENNSMREEMGRLGREFVMGRFSVQRLVNDVRSLYFDEISNALNASMIK